MKRRNPTEQSSIINRMHENIKAYNNYMPDKYLNRLNLHSLLRLCNPIDRIDFATELYKKGIFTANELAQIKV